MNMDGWRENPYWKPGSPTGLNWHHEPVYSERNYDLFTLLADARNYEPARLTGITPGSPVGVATAAAIWLAAKLAECAPPTPAQPSHRSW